MRQKVPAVIGLLGALIGIWAWSDTGEQVWVVVGLSVLLLCFIITKDEEEDQ